MKRQPQGTISHKGFLGSTDYDDNAETFFGTVVNANIIMSFRGSSVDELKRSFHDAVDTYIDDCEREGRIPEKPFSGKITLRVSPLIHRRIAIKAAEHKESMNQYIEELIVRETADLEETNS
jgi:predicted HicB family RNase H-like nuclease